MTSDNELDRKIDDVARGMTAGHPDSNLRARVLERIEQPTPFAWRPVFATACAAGAVAALLFVASRSRVPSIDRPDNRPPVVARTEPARTTAAAPVDGTVAAPPVARPASERARAVSRPPSAVGLAEPPITEEPLTVDSIAVAPIAPESIAVEELPSITPIAVAPLGPGEQR